jgi:predicted RNA-binding Zn-ribbon protein involved in translation (DUF1610 family)
MSKSNNHEIECPECGETQEVTVWDSINVDLDPALREKLFAADINQYHCSSCGYEMFLDAPLLYHDMTRQFFVQYHPSSSFDDPDNAFRRYDVTGDLDLTSSLDMKMHAEKTGKYYLTMPHVVFDMNEMILYILFREFLYSRGKEA